MIKKYMQNLQNSNSKNFIYFKYIKKDIDVLG